MIYLAHTTSPQVVRIPASAPKAGGTVTLSMVNTINRGEALSFDFDQAVYLVDADGNEVHDADGLQVVVADVADTSRLYYVLTIELGADVTPGEYEYTAAIDGETVSCGLAIVGEPEADVTHYDNSVQYDQYNYNG